MDDRSSSLERDIHAVRIQVGPCERRLQRLELAGLVRPRRHLDLEERLPRREVVGLLDVRDTGQLEKDLVIA
jgi:hypothetical protein